MITVTRLNGHSITLNLLLVESIEATPDTVIALTTGNKYVVKESVDEIINLARKEWQSIGLGGAAANIHKEEGWR